MSRPNSYIWFAQHELRLNGRDWIAMMTAGRPARRLWVIGILCLVTILFHWIAYILISKAEGNDTKTMLIWLSGSGVFFFAVMMSQAIESVTRAYYARSDLDLVLSSPAIPERLFAIRTCAVALTTLGLAVFLTGPAINVLSVLDGPHWLAAYPVLAALSALATALATGIAAGLFRLVGPKRTRLIAQILAAIVGAGFIIGVQVAGILAYGEYSRFALLGTEPVAAMAPPLDSFLWIPARAAQGELGPLLMTVFVGIGALLVAIRATSSRFAHRAISTASLSHARHDQTPTRTGFRIASPAQVLRGKEWKLLKRDPWLLSQTLMQLLYLVPPALMMWLNYGSDTGIYIVVVPLIVLACGQLAGGLAWLAISGEDAHDLMATAPISPRAVTIAKVQSVVAVVAVLVLPLLVLMGVGSVFAALVAAFACALSAGSATSVQLWFRSQAQRSMFRRRQTSSRIATICEAFVSILWAGTAAMVLTSPVLASVPAVLALGFLLIAWALSPKGNVQS